MYNYNMEIALLQRCIRGSLVLSYNQWWLWLFGIDIYLFNMPLPGTRIHPS